MLICREMDFKSEIPASELKILSASLRILLCFCQLFLQFFEYLTTACIIINYINIGHFATPPCQFSLRF